MVENIHYYDNKDDSYFDDLTLANPCRLQGGAYFSKLSCNEEPFLFQTPKSSTKKGVIFTNKKAYCDLLFVLLVHVNQMLSFQWKEVFTTMIGRCIMKQY